MTCTTHSYACDCREERMRRLEDASAAYRAHSVPMVGCDKYGRMLDEALKELDRVD